MKIPRAVAVLPLIFLAASASARQVIVGFSPQTSAAERARTLAELGLKPVEELAEINAQVAEAPEVSSLADIETAALASPGVSGFEEDVVLDWLRSGTFESTLLPSLTDVLSQLGPLPKPAALPPLPAGVAPEEVPWGIQRVNAPNAWAASQGAGIKVAVLDTGIDFGHPDLAAAYGGCYNAMGGSSCFDDNEHGTHVAGTIAAAWDGKGVVGVAPKARLYAVKILDKEGKGGLVSIIKGLIWCGRHGMQVANMSLGAPIGTIFMRAAAAYAASQGVTIVAAAGNNGGRVDCPACYPSAIAVSAGDRFDRIADFSSRGEKVEFIAPGVDVKSTVPGGRYEFMSGTSMATPHVTGLAALAVSRGAASPQAVRAKLKAAARPIGLPPAQQGAGLIDAALIR